MIILSAALQCNNPECGSVYLYRVGVPKNNYSELEAKFHPMEQQAQNEGWTIAPDHSHWCPNCTRQLGQEKEALTVRVARELAGDDNATWSKKGFGR